MLSLEFAQDQNLGLFVLNILHKSYQIPKFIILCHESTMDGEDVDLD